MNALIRRHADVLATPLDDTLLMMSVEKGMYYSLNPIASRIWELLAEPTTVADIVRQLQREYDVGAEQCGTEVTAFLAALRDRNLLQEAA